MKYWIVLCALLFSAHNSWGGNECESNSVGYELCKKTKELAGELSRRLPNRISKNLTIETATAKGNVLELTAVLDYNKKFLKNAADNGGVTLTYLENKMRNFSRSYICEPRTMPAEFISMGGVIHDVYKFNDGSLYLTVVIDKCP